MPVTYDSLASTTLSATSTTIDFTSISSAYTDLIVVAQYQCTVSGGLNYRLNSDTGNLYSFINMIGMDGTNTSYSGTDTIGWPDTYLSGTGADTNDRALTVIHFMNYTSTNMFKVALCRSGNYRTSNGGVSYQSIVTYRSTSAITAINLIANGAGAFVTSSTFSLYGIKAN